MYTVVQPGPARSQHTRTTISRGPGRIPRDQHRTAELRRHREEFLETLFSSLSRRDQRVRGEHYLRGLLLAEGRKSVRNIALSLGWPDEEQRLHHFICGSTWDWKPMRAAHAGFLDRLCPPQAWVLHAVTIPKDGEHTVGVDRFLDPQAGRSVSGQRAFGAWYASTAFSAPVNWKLFMPRHWIDDEALRGRADIPPAVGYESMERCAADTVLEAARDWPVAPRPVLMDLRADADWQSARRLAAGGLPVVARIAASTRFVVDDPGLPGFDEWPVPAASILESARFSRRAVDWADPGGSGSVHTSSVAAVRVRVAGAGLGHQRPLVLLGEWRHEQEGPAQVWVSDLADTTPADLLKLTKLTRKVALDRSLGADRTGARDFVGRSFCGWHRHMTLASAAHTMRLLALRGGR
ncbi:transposase [Streptomyces sp. AK08-02]|uniref:IS701 family transposase n=1 Tax=Streptomyces sp. AK08-02 TaxID=3028654 RepID=UPI0029B9FDE6|nr:transposase [Streptomyces sp. AK08-02]MDX3747945.1 transposase [Streptomyces sp. AK08-02]